MANFVNTEIPVLHLCF